MPLRNRGLATPVKRKTALLVVDINGVIDPGTQTSCVGIEYTGKPENVNTTIVVISIVLSAAKNP